MWIIHIYIWSTLNEGLCAQS